MLVLVFNIKIKNKTGFQLCAAISLQKMCVKFCQNVGKLLFSGVSRMSGLYPGHGIKMKEIKVAEINPKLN